MLEISKFSWSNFLSFGDYVSTVDVSALRECLITGIIEDESGAAIEGKSNGAGKSNIIAALQWTLFGRTVHSANPGGKIRNHFTNSDTWGKIVLDNGDSILRTRKADGTTEVVFYHSGQEQCVVADTLGTLRAQQAQLAQAFGLDWDIFSKSVFFSCFDKPWMQMSDQKRKEVLERLLKLDRLAYYAKSAAGRAGSDSTELQKQQTAIQSRISFLTDLRNQVEAQKQAVQQFETGRQNRLAAKEQQRIIVQNSLNEMPEYDLDQINEQWNEYENTKAQIMEKITVLQTKRNEVANSYNYSSRRAADLQREIAAWAVKLGTTCASCGQPVSDDHIHDQTNPKEAEKTTLEQQLPTQKQQIAAMDNMLQQANQMIVNKQPEIDSNYARTQMNYRANLIGQITTIDQEIQSISAEQPPNTNTIQELHTSLGRIKSEIAQHTTASAELENRILHLDYIRKAYSDRNKVKRDIVADHIPFINERLRYYLDILDLEVRIQLTDSLGIESNYWGYEFQSNGEKRRTDVAMMFATFDLHEQLYGRQCNILALDEVDGQMDRQGIDALVHIIKNDLSSRTGAIFVISHMDTMQSVFGSEIRVRKRGKLSYLEQ